MVSNGPGGCGKLDERELERAALDPLVEVEIGRGGLGRPDPHVRPLGAEPPEQLRQDADPDRLGDPDAEQRLASVGERRDVGLGDLEPPEDRARMHEHDLAGLGQRHRPPAARALDQPLPGDPLERGDLAADRRLHEAELLGRPPERSLAGDSVERRQMPNLDPEPMIGLHDSSRTIVHRR